MLDGKDIVTLSTLGHTWILDLDGTILKHNGYKLDGGDSLLSGTRAFFQDIPDGDMIVFITSREESMKDETEAFLQENGIPFHSIIYGAPYGERILINDEKPSGLLMAKSLCVKRDAGIQLKIQIDDRL